MRLRALGILLLLAGFLAAGLTSASPPRPVPSSAPPTEFSAERALAHLTVIAARPHPTGSAAAEDVRAYVSAQLRGFGFVVEEQEATAISDTAARARGAPVIAARVRNLIARRPGTSPGPGLLLLSHYDSRELAPGASDDGFGVAALLETARALAASPPLRHDVWMVFTDGEEEGLFGARAFFDESPAAKEVGLVLNFEARGDRGPTLMFETSPAAGPLVDVLAREAPHVVATSISQEVYRRMPNSTDFTIALGARVPGLNFSNIDGYERYHQVTDTVANASLGTLQHHGSYALSLARAFGDRDFPRPGGEEVYFRLGPLFVHYSAKLALPIAALATFLLLVWARRAVRAGGATPGRIAAGTLLGVGAIVAGLAASMVLAYIAGRANAALSVPQIRASVRITYV
ncbi:MAG TPA: M20/M25/M40 family metallo-hydrolase, partial [Polyangiaceae bacterium]